MNTLQKTIATTASLIVFNVAIFIFIIYPVINDIRAFNDRIALERVALENKYTSRRNIKNIIADLKYVSDGLAPLEKSMIIQKNGEVDFINALEKIAEKNNLPQKIRIIPAGTQDAKQGLAAKQNISITLAGDYIDVLKYMGDLEKSAFYVIINSVNLSSGENSADKNTAGIIKAYLEGHVYFSI